MERKGIISAGNWLIDHIKMIDIWPQQGNLCNIKYLAELSPGGCSHNVLIDLARLQSGIPLWAGGIVGNDDDGKYILNIIKKYNIDSKYMEVRDGVATSFTDVMSVIDTGARTFFHNRGANALLGFDEVAKMDAPAKIFHLGYLLLLDKMDSPDSEYGTVAARTLKMLQEKGYETSIDVVSEEGERFQKIVTPSLKYTDYLICNEVEAGACANIDLQKNGDVCVEKLPQVAEYLFNKGVNKLVIIHFPEGGFAMNKAGEQIYIEQKFKTPKSQIKSTVGAGDAFCAGSLYAIHEGYSLADILTFANANARFNLLSENSTEGAVPLSEVQDFIKKNS